MGIEIDIGAFTIKIGLIFSPNHFYIKSPVVLCGKNYQHLIQPINPTPF